MSGLTFSREKVFFLSKQTKETSNCFNIVYSLSKKMEEHSWKIIRSLNQIIFVFLYNNLRFSICQLFEYSSDQEWNQTLNDAYIYGRGLEYIYLNRCKQKIFFVFIRYITNSSLIFLIKNIKRTKNGIILFMSIIICIRSFTLDWNLSKSVYILD